LNQSSAWMPGLTASPYAIMRRAYPYRGENPGPGKDVHGELDHCRVRGGGAEDAGRPSGELSIPAFKVENIAPGHCTGEPTFAALKQAFGGRYIYAGVGTTLAFGPSMATGERRGEAPALDENDLTSYRRLAAREDPFGVLALWARKQFVHHAPTGETARKEGALAIQL
jgi:hypothetical protein